MLLAILRLGDAAYAPAILEEIEATNRTAAVARVDVRHTRPPRGERTPAIPSRRRRRRTRRPPAALRHGHRLSACASCARHAPRCSSCGAAWRASLKIPDAIEPPRLAEWLVRIAVARSRYADALIGDLHEGFADVAARSPLRLLRAGIGDARSRFPLRFLPSRLRASRAVTCRAHRRSGHDDVPQRPSLRDSARSVARRASRIAAILALGLGTGSAAGVFSLLRGVVLRPLPYSRAGAARHALGDEPREGARARADLAGELRRLSRADQRLRRRRGVVASADQPHRRRRRADSRQRDRDDGESVLRARRAPDDRAGLSDPPEAVRSGAIRRSSAIGSGSRDSAAIATSSARSST